MTIKSAKVTVPINTAIYADGDAVGNLLTFPIPSPRMLATRSGSILGVRIIDLDSQAAPIDIILLKPLSAFTTVVTNNAAVDLSDADAMAGYLGKIPVLAGDYEALADNSVAQVWANPPIPFDVSAGSSIRAILVSRGTPTYTVNTNLQVELIFDLQ